MNTRSLLYKYRYDLALQEGPGARLLTWVTGIMVFLMTLALIFNATLSNVSRHWISGISGSLTVEMPGGDGAGTADAQKILSLLRRHPDIEKADILTSEQVQKLVEPWLGRDIAATSTLPLPLLIDATLKNGRTIRVPALEQQLRQSVRGVRVTDHTDWLGGLVSFGRALKSVAFLLAAAVSLLAVITIAGIIHARYDVHRADAELLHLMGASDDYIARQFQADALSGAFRGALIGALSAIFIALVFGWFVHGLALTVLPNSGLFAKDWIMLALVPPLAGCAIAFMTARVTLMRALLKLP